MFKDEHRPKYTKEETPKSSEGESNFQAQIIETIKVHENEESLVYYKMQCTHVDGQVESATVRAEDFESPVWVNKLGRGEFTLSASRKDRAEFFYEIKTTSNPRLVLEYRSTGWVVRNGEPAYIHAGGAIGKDGPITDVRVNLPDHLSGYILPAPPFDSKQAIRASLAMMSLGRVGALVSLAYRAALGWTPFTVHIGGPTGSRKTTVAELLLQHFSTTTRSREGRLTLQWNSTANAVQGVSHACRDSLLVIDDLKFSRDLSTFDEVTQFQGNGLGRSRMDQDQSMKPPLRPRGALLSTGEVDGVSESSRGRTLTIELMPDDIDLSLLSAIQMRGERGLFAEAMSAFIRWLASRLNDILADFKVRTRELTPTVRGPHSRHPGIGAELIAAFEIFANFAVEVGAITHKQAARRIKRVERSIRSLIADLEEEHGESRLGRKFLDLVASVLSTGQYYLANFDELSQAPEGYEVACGWRAKPGFVYDLPPNGKKLGYISIDRGIVYLEPDATASVIQRMMTDGKDYRSLANVGRELINEQLCIVYTERTREGTTRRRATQYLTTREGSERDKKRYYHIPIKNIFGDPELGSRPAVLTAFDPEDLDTCIRSAP
jgi:hypothetical protein